MRPQIVQFGDSMTEMAFYHNGWGAALTNHYMRKADVMNRGTSGFNTSMALTVLNFLFPLEHPIPYIAATIFFGANDASLPGSMSPHYVPIDMYKENLRKIVQHFKKCSPSIKIVMITPPPVDEAGRIRYYKSVGKPVTQSDRKNIVTGEYAKKCVELANELGLPHVNLWSKMQETKDWRQKFLLHNDGLHLTPEGNAVVYEEVVRAFNETGLVAKEMPFDSPYANVTKMETTTTFKPPTTKMETTNVNPRL